jgi:hypothetical protein
MKESIGSVTGDGLLCLLPFLILNAQRRPATGGGRQHVWLRPIRVLCWGRQALIHSASANTMTVMPILATSQGPPCRPVAVAVSCCCAWPRGLYLISYRNGSIGPNRSSTWHVELEGRHVDMQPPTYP